MDTMNHEHEADAQSPCWACYAMARVAHQFSFAGFKQITDRDGNWKSYRTCQCGAVKASPVHRVAVAK